MKDISRYYLLWRGSDSETRSVAERTSDTIRILRSNRQKFLSYRNCKHHQSCYLNLLQLTQHRRPSAGKNLDKRFFYDLLCCSAGCRTVSQVMSCFTKFGLYVFSITVSAYFSPSLTTLCGRRLPVDVSVIRLSPNRLPVCCRRNTKVRLLPWKSLKGFSSRVHLRFILLRLNETG